MKRYNIIVESNIEPEDKNVLWLKNKKIKQFTDKGWEDITSSSNTEVNEDDLIIYEGKIKFSDREYDTKYFSGKGYKILRRFIEDSTNVITQDMINSPNTIYEIRYDFDLNGAELIIPKGCILKFNGGSFKNGVLTGDNTIIKVNTGYIFDNIILKGYFNGEGKSSYFINTSDTDLFYSLIRFEIATFDDKFYLNLTDGSKGLYDIKNRGLILQSNSKLYITCNFDLKKSLLNLACESNDTTYFYYKFKNINIRFPELDFDNIPVLSATERYFLINIASYTLNSDYHKVILDVDNCDIESWSVPFRCTLYTNTDFEFHFNNTNIKSADFCTEFYWDRVPKENRLCSGDCTIDNSNIISTHSASLSNGTNDTQRLYLRNSNFMGRHENGFSYVTAINCNFLTTDKTENVRIGFGGINQNFESDTFAEDAKLELNNCTVITNVYTKFSHFNSMIFNQCLFDLKSGTVFCEKADNVTILNSYIINRQNSIQKVFDKSLLSQVKTLNIINSTFNLLNKLILLPDYAIQINNNYISFTEYVDAWYSYFKNGSIITPSNEVRNISNKTLNYDSESNKWLNNRGLLNGNRLVGSTSQRPSESLDLNFYFDTSLGKVIVFKDGNWVNLDGTNTAILNSGTFEQRPTEAQGISKGYTYFCTDKQTPEGETDGIIITYKGDNIWVDAFGRTIS